MAKIVFKALPAVQAHALAGYRLAPEDVLELVNSREALQKLFIIDERYADACVDTAYVSIAMMTGCVLPLITLLELWMHDEPGWVMKCRDCGDKALIFGYGGSPLSGRGSGWGICPYCGKSIRIPFSLRAALRAVELARAFRQNTKKGRRITAEREAYRVATHHLQGGQRAWEEKARSLERKASAPMQTVKVESEKDLTVFDVLNYLHEQSIGKMD